jgi:hypothetical protein
MAMKMYQYNLNTSLGADNMRFLAGISNEDDRMAAEAALLKGKSPDMVKIETKQGTLGALPTDGHPKLRLEKEKSRLERTIATLSKRLDEVERELEQY